MNGFHIREMTREEVDLALEWAAREGWNPGLSDADCFHAADPSGFLIGCLGDEPVGCISLVRYDSGFAFLGFFIVRPEMRGRGRGQQLWQAALQRARGCIGLDGVVMQQENYKRSGFVLDHRNIRFGGTVLSEPPRDEALASISSDTVSDLIRYDRAFFPADRDAFLRCWLGPGDRIGIALVEDGSIRGYGVIRPCRTGWKIGPLFADTEHGADLLLRALAVRAEGNGVFLDCPEPNRSATALAERHGLSPVFATARMYRGPAPRLPLSRTFGITTFELG